MKKHLAIMNRATIEAILAGKKTVETRFSLHKIAPFGLVSIGDLVYMKLPGDEIVGQFRVKKVFSYEGLAVEDVEKIFRDYGTMIAAGDKAADSGYFEAKRGSKYGTLIVIGESERLITSPIIFRKSDQRGWVVMK